MILTLAFAGLGVWQFQRLAWRNALNADLARNISAQPSNAPSPEAWRDATARDFQYRRVAVTGRFEPARAVLVQAVTERGPGFWLLEPFHADDGYVVLINRGFVPQDARGAPAQWRPPPSGETRLTGLLRLTEPHGGFLRANDPAHNRWRSRDVEAIGRHIGVSPLAGYFIDADLASDAPERPPIGGMTRLRLPNSHLAYALTWCSLALMVIVAWAHAWSHTEDARE
jgi:surfeit locus 1 family protein